MENNISGQIMFMTVLALFGSPPWTFEGSSTVSKRFLMNMLERRYRYNKLLAAIMQIFLQLKKCILIELLGECFSLG